jgi:hypothetical protein
VSSGAEVERSNAVAEGSPELTLGSHPWPLPWGSSRGRVAGLRPLADEGESRRSTGVSQRETVDSLHSPEKYCRPLGDVKHRRQRVANGRPPTTLPSRPLATGRCRRRFRGILRLGLGGLAQDDKHFGVIPTERVLRVSGGICGDAFAVTVIRDRDRDRERDRSAHRTDSSARSLTFPRSD